MSNYTAPGMTVEFRHDNTPQASAPSNLEDLYLGRAIQIEKDVYLGEYTSAGGLAGAGAITGIMDDATLISDDEISISIQLDADASIVDVLAADWVRSSETISSISTSLMKPLVEHDTVLDGTLVVATRLLSSPTVDFGSVGIVQNKTFANLTDADDNIYPATGAYEVAAGSGSDIGKLYFSGTGILPEMKLTMTTFNPVNWVVGADVYQHAASAFLTGGGGAESGPGTWAAVTNGSFHIDIDGTGYDIDTIVFTGDLSMTDVATTIESAIQTATGNLETVVWSVDHFIISSVDDTSSSAITVLSTSGGTVGTDLATAGWTDCTTNGVVTAADGVSGEIVLIDAGTKVAIVGDVTGGTFAAGAVTEPDADIIISAAAIGLVGFDVNLIMDGSAMISYKAFRTDLCGAKTKVTKNTLLALAGNQDSIVPENALIWAAKMATDLGDYCYIQGVDDMAGWIDEYNATASAWNTEFAALKFQSQKTCAYQYGILSENSEVHSYTDLFLSWMRIPAKSKLVIAWTSFPLFTMDYVVREESVGAYTGASTTFTIAGRDFGVLGLEVGGSILLHNPADSDDDVTIVVSNVSGATVTLATAAPTTTSTWTYEAVNAIYSLDEIANAAKVYADGYSTSALRFAWCSTLSMKYDGTVYSNLPKYFWFVYRAADLAGSEDISKTYTRHEVTYLFEEATLPFLLGDTDRLDTVASGGVDIIVQEVANGPLFSRHALTTNMTDNTTREQCATHQYDYAALTIFSTFRDDIGKKKITKKFKAHMLNKFTAIKQLLKRKQCLEYLSLLSLEVDPENSTRMILTVDGKAIMPFNNLGIIFYTK